MLTTDSFFEQGVKHDVCEDYALHGPDYAVVSDGCSNGGNPIHTDWGSRILCKVAEDEIATLRSFHPKLLFEDVADRAEEVCGAVPGLDPDCLTATLLLAFRQGETVRTLLMGDGVFGGRLRAGGWRVTAFSQTLNAPFYPSYLGKDLSAYYDKFGRQYQIASYACAEKFAAVEATSKEVELSESEPWFSAEFPLDEYDLVFIGSDGLASFSRNVPSETTKCAEPVPLTEVLEVLFDVPAVVRPNFLRAQRRWAFKRAVTGTFVHRGWRNGDDVSVAAVYRP